MAQRTVEIKVRLAWWLIPYLRALSLWCSITRSEPNYSKVERIVARGVRAEAE